jgi:hypothetical protein
VVDFEQILIDLQKIQIKSEAEPSSDCIKAVKNSTWRLDKANNLFASFDNKSQEEVFCSPHPNPRSN